MQAGKVVQTRIDTWQGDLNPTEYRIWSMLISDEAYGLRPGGITRLDSLEWELLQSVEEVIAPFSESVTSLLANTLKDKLP